MSLHLRLLAATFPVILLAASAPAAQPTYALTDLEVDPDHYLVPTDINNSGQIVGYYSLLNGRRRSFLYDQKTGNLTTLSIKIGSYAQEQYNPTSNSAAAINDRGQIVGYIDGTIQFGELPSFGSYLYDLAKGEASFLGGYGPFTKNSVHISDFSDAGVVGYVSNEDAPTVRYVYPAIQPQRQEGVIGLINNLGHMAGRLGNGTTDEPFLSGISGPFPAEPK